MLKKIKRSIALLLSVILTFQPVIVYAADVRPLNPGSGPRPHVDQARNGTQVINISTPNSSGVSHDRYTKFNVDDLILNNSATITDTRLGGWIEGNPNLKTGSEAKSWIAEVVGGNQTQLGGVLEVAGERMDVILANEFGITCNGCGFINTGRTTLTTGQPRFDRNGALADFDVRKGTVTIGADGLNQDSRLLATDRSRVDVISRAAALYGAVYADKLNVVTGANKVDYDWSYDDKTGEVKGITPQSGSADTPELAVDVSALGGMYANAIKLVATENGVGVRLNGQLASATNISLSANGKLSVGKPANKHTPLLKAHKKISIRNKGPILLEGAVVSQTDDAIYVSTSEGSLTAAGEISGGAITLEGAGLVAISNALKSQGNLRVTSLNNSVTQSKQAKISASNLTVSSADNISLNGNVAIENSADLNAEGKITTGATSTVAARALTLSAEELQTNGHVSAAKNLVLNAKAGGITNRGALKGQSLSLTSQSDFTNAGKIAVDETAQLSVAGKFASDTGSELFARNIEMTVGSAAMKGIIKADNNLDITSRSGSINSKATLTGSAVSLASATDMRIDGTISAARSARLAANGQILSSQGSQVSADTITISAGEIEANGDLIAGSDEDAQVGTSVTLTTRSGNLTTRGAVTADAVTLTSAADLITDGTVTGHSTATLSADAHLTMNDGSELHGTDLTLSGHSVSLAGVVKAGNLLQASTTSGKLSITGDLSGRTILLTSQAGLEHAGVIDASNTATLSAADLLQTSSGSALYANTITATAASIVNGGDIRADETATLKTTTGAFTNTGLIGAKDLVLNAASHFEHSGKLVGTKSVMLDATGNFSSETGSEISARTIALKAASIEADGDIIADKDDGPIAETTLELVTRSGDLVTRGALTADITTLTSAADLITDGTVTGHRTATLSADAHLTM
ncbi:two-partner secretion domain-containing protein, partial [Pseudovibrio sp. WM33]|uniref:two-partner secretion domain-containing protein n=1 Tax=Pseudovibrio sp. WM33 TaxID=1735585 RepID=UPI00187D1BCB